MGSTCAKHIGLFGNDGNLVMVLSYRQRKNVCKIERLCSKKGFIKERETLGWKWTDGKNTFNRLRCRANMDDRGLTQKDHAEELGWYKIYDAGQRLYVKILI